MGKQKENASIRIVQDTDKQEEHWRSTDQEYWKVKRDVEIEKEKLTIVVEKEKIKKKMLREIYEELENKNRGEICELAVGYKNVGIQKLKDILEE